MPEVSYIDNARINFINEYAKLEQELRGLLQHTLAIGYEEASVILFSISSTRVRYAIMSKILKLRHPETFAHVWKKVETWLIPCDTFRNQVVHWVAKPTIVVAFNAENQAFFVNEKLDLENQAALMSIRHETKISIERIEEMTDRVNCVKHIVNRFGITIHEPDVWPWTDIFRQPIPHQNPEEFLQRLSDKGLPVQPSSWRVSPQSE